MKACKRIVFLVLALSVCSTAYAEGFSVSVCVTDRLSDKERQFLNEAGCPLTDKADKKDHVTVTLSGDDASETYAAQQAVAGLTGGADGIIFRCRKNQLVRYDFDRRPYPGPLAGTLAVLEELLGEIEAGSAARVKISGVPLYKVKKDDGTFAYLAYDKGRRKVKLELGEATWRVASLVAASGGKIRRVFRKTDTVSGTLTPAPVMISAVWTKPQQEDKAADFWDAKEYHEVHLSFSAEAWRALRERAFRDQFKKEYVKADFECGGKRLQDVGVRLKGNSSLRAGSRGGRFPFKIDFDRFKEQQFLGMKKLNLSNNFKDPSMIREYLAYELFRKSGLCAGRAAFVKLYVSVEGAFKRRSYGLYTAVEQVDGNFLHRWFGNSEGTLFKPEVFGDDPLRYLSDDPKHYARCEVKSGEMHPDYDALIRLAKFAEKAPEDEFAGKIKDMLDIDTFLKFLAVNALLANYDSYIGTGHNFYLYYDAPNARFVFIPWDLNEAFGMFTPRGYNPKTCAGVSILKPVAMGRRALVERILSVEQWRELYEKHLITLLEGEFVQERLLKRVEELRKIIEPAVKEEGARKSRELRLGVEQLKEFIKDRDASALYELMMR